MKYSVVFVFPLPFTLFPLYPSLSVRVAVRLYHRVGDAAAGCDRVRGRVLGEALERGEESAKLVALCDGCERVARLSLDSRGGVVAEDSNHVEVQGRLLFALRSRELL